MSEESGNGTVRRTTRKAAEPGAPKPVRARRSATATTKASAALPLGTQAIAVEPKSEATPHAIVVPEPQGRRVEATTVNITQGGAGEVEAESVTVAKGGIAAASAEDITVIQGGIGRAEADDIAVRMGAIGCARAERISVELGAIGVAIGSDVSVTQGFARTVLARNAVVHQGGARTIVAGNVTLEGRSSTIILVARKVEGDVRTVLDWRGALAVGAGLALAAGLLRLGKRSKE
jgi:hypothetical protein